MTGPIDDFAFNPDISFPNTNIGNQLKKTLVIVQLLIWLPGVEKTLEQNQCRVDFLLMLLVLPVSPVLNRIKFTMEVLCNLFFFLCRVNQYQGAKTKDQQPPSTLEQHKNFYYENYQKLSEYKKINFKIDSLSLYRYISSLARDVILIKMKY